MFILCRFDVDSHMVSAELEEGEDGEAINVMDMNLQTLEESHRMNSVCLLTSSCIEVESNVELIPLSRIRRRKEADQRSHHRRGNLTIDHRIESAPRGTLS